MKVLAQKMGSKGTDPIFLMKEKRVRSQEARIERDVAKSSIRGNKIYFQIGVFASQVGVKPCANAHERSFATPPTVSKKRTLKKEVKFEYAPVCSVCSRLFCQLRGPFQLHW